MKQHGDEKNKSQGGGWRYWSELKGTEEQEETLAFLIYKTCLYFAFAVKYRWQHAFYKAEK